MTEPNENEAIIYTDANGLPEAVADVHQIQQAGIELAAYCALHGDDRDATYAAIIERASDAGPAGSGVLMAAVATLAELLNSAIPLVEEKGWPLGEHLHQLAVGEPIDFDSVRVRQPNISPSRAERRKKRRQ